MNGRAGYIYILRGDLGTLWRQVLGQTMGEVLEGLLERGRGIYKIGLSKDPYARCGDIGLRQPFAVQPVLTIYAEDRYWAEKQLHQWFAPQRLNGEWFVLDRGHLSMLQDLRDELDARECARSRALHSGGYVEDHLEDALRDNMDWNGWSWVEYFDW